MARQMEKRDQEIEKRDLILSNLLQEVHLNGFFTKNVAGRLQHLSRDVRSIAQVLVFDKPYSECKRGYPIKVTGIYIKYPATGQYKDNENCEWNIEVPGNISITFKQFELSSRRSDTDYITIYEGRRKVGKWDGSSKPPLVLNLQGNVTIIFKSGGGGVYHNFHDMWNREYGFMVYVESNNNTNS